MLSMEGLCWLRISAIYASPNRYLQENFCYYLTHLGTLVKVSWLLDGEFNQSLTHSSNKGATGLLDTVSMWEVNRCVWPNWMEFAWFLSKLSQKALYILDWFLYAIWSWRLFSKLLRTDWNLLRPLLLSRTKVDLFPTARQR